jgi:hypothetical protein
LEFSHASSADFIRQRKLISYFRQFGEAMGARRLTADAYFNAWHGKDGNDVLLTLFDESCTRYHPAEIFFLVCKVHLRLDLCFSSLEFRYSVYHPLPLFQLLGLSAALTVQSENEDRGAAENVLVSPRVGAIALDIRQSEGDFSPHGSLAVAC